MREFPDALAVGDEIGDGVNGKYTVERIRAPLAEGGLGLAWAALRGSDGPARAVSRADEPAP
jgi:hypothetical protein